MDVAYDHIQEEVLSPDEASKNRRQDGKSGEATLNTELADAYTAISSSQWGARFGAFLGNVKKHGETYYEGARQEYSAASSQASKGLTDIISRTRSVSLHQPGVAGSEGPSNAESLASSDGAEHTADPSAGGRSRSVNASASESDGILSRFRSEASKRLKEIEKAEDAADEALLKFGTNLRNFLRDAVTIAPPPEGAEGQDGHAKGQVLFESTGLDGKRAIHTTRFDAQLHVINSTKERFMMDPPGPEYLSWKESFSVDSKTEDISKDLDTYKDLRETMEALVPDHVSYEQFWTRYYFFKHAIETEEKRRKDLLKGVAAQTEEEILWGEDSDNETPAAKGTSSTVVVKNPSSIESSTTLHPNTVAAGPTDDSSLKPCDPRKSNDQHSQPDSDASYDVVSSAPSGAPSHAPGSPREEKKPATGDESDEEDWE